MNSGHQNVSSYLLIDNGLLEEVSASYTEVDSRNRPLWLEPIYPDYALAVSPLLVDLDAAYEAGDIDLVMSYVNARAPALHVSIIETELNLEQIAQHLRKFIFIVAPDDKQFTLRYADGTVLATLAAVLTTAQWATMKGPISRWGVHDRSGTLTSLPPAEPVAYASTPFCLNHDQLAALDEASEPDHCIAKVKMMRHVTPLPGNTAEQHTWALAAREVWRAAGNSNASILLFLTESTLISRGTVLRRNEIQNFLAMDEANAFRENLQDLVKKMAEC
ncbi:MULTISPECIES: DUF4123 domain-containing protein [unclassified Massilia]|uniref:DUF4123 domain-containing protein n=1 Tax=unclassified Massilia TaxID=2609279 RepID=UPI000713BA0B|nr:MULTISPECIES: DUF4123 domain-containing protein [unclassified Massilia]KQZ46893.1 hypothetical protein ASD92_23790 [Massilia sp. Root1485]